MGAVGLGGSIQKIVVVKIIKDIGMFFKKTSAQYGFGGNVVLLDGFIKTVFASVVLHAAFGGNSRAAKENGTVTFTDQSDKL